MSRNISAARVATLVGNLTGDERPLYLELAEGLRLLIGEGRIPAATRLPSERELTTALGVSRTTVTRAYAELRDREYAESRRGSGTVTRLPLRAQSVTDRVFAPWSQDPDVIDLNCAAPSAPAGVAAAYEAAVAELPPYLSSHGYYPAGLTRLREVARRDLRRARAAHHSRADHGDQRARWPARPWSRRPSPPPATGWSSRTRSTPTRRRRWATAARAWCRRRWTPTAGTSPRRPPSCARPPRGWPTSIPDFQNPTGLVMSDAQRPSTPPRCRRARVIPVVDEAHQALALDGQAMPAPVRVPLSRRDHHRQRQQAVLGRPAARLAARARDDDAGAAAGPDEPRPRGAAARAARPGAPGREPARRVGGQPRAAAAGSATCSSTRLADAAARLVVPATRGGLAVWCRLPQPRASALVAEAERLGVIAAAGRVFAVEGGLEHFVRLPWTRPDRRAGARRRAARTPGRVAHGRAGDGGAADRLTVA